MPGAEARRLFEAGVERGLELGVVRPADELPQSRLHREILHKAAVLDGAIAGQLVEELAQQIVAVADLDQRVFTSKECTIAVRTCRRAPIRPIRRSRNRAELPASGARGRW